MQGSIQKRAGKRGVTWKVVIDLDRDPITGKRRQKRLTAPSKSAAEELLTKTLHDLRSGTYVEESALTLSQYLTQWASAIAPTVKPSTILRYRGVITSRLTPALGGVKIAKLTALQIQTYYAAALKDCSPAYVRLQHAVLNRALGEAVKWQMLAKNPCAVVQPPQAPKRQFVTWTAEQARQFLDATRDNPYYPIWRLALGTTLRMGEILGLNWQDIDFERATLQVRRTRTVTPEGPTLGDPKTRSSRRQIQLARSLVNDLREYRVRASMLGMELIFVGTRGQLLSATVVREAFYRAAVKAGLPHIRFHDLRHTAASLMLQNGEQPKVVQENLGHSTISMTMDLYSHTTTGMHREAAERLDGLLRA
jgi:integrase